MNPALPRRKVLVEILPRDFAGEGKPLLGRGKLNKAARQGILPSRKNF